MPLASLPRSRALRPVAPVAVGVVVVLAGVWLLARIGAPVDRLLPTGPIAAPEDEVRAYHRALARGDGPAALRLWRLSERELPGGRAAALGERRREVTRALLEAGIGERVMIRGVEWWRTCCEPGVVGRPEEAGGARVLVQFADRGGAPLVYAFDVFRGGAGGGWAIRDVFGQGQEPLYWRLVHTATVRSLDDRTGSSTGLVWWLRDPPGR